MGLWVIAASILSAIWFAVVVYCASLSGIRAIRAEAAYARHPHARKWRPRPLVSVMYSGQPTAASLFSIRRSSYHTTEIVLPGRRPTGDLLLPLDARAVLGRTDIRRAVLRLQAYPGQQSVSLTPSTIPFTTTRDFLYQYRIILSLPLSGIRELFGTKEHYAVPVLTRSQAKWQSTAYIFCSHLLATLHLIVIGFIVFGALRLGLSDLPLIYLGSIVLWLLWSASLCPNTSLLTKIIHVVLAPASFTYMTWRLVAMAIVPRRIINAMIKT